MLERGSHVIDTDSGFGHRAYLSNSIMSSTMKLSLLAAVWSNPVKMPNMYDKERHT